jgi:hypothetical protein
MAAIRSLRFGKMDFRRAQATDIHRAFARDWHDRNMISRENGTLAQRQAVQYKAFAIRLSN